MLLKNARLLTDDFQWMLGDLRIENGRIAEIGVTRTAGDEVLDCTGLTLVPGLVDIHTHGAAGCDNMDANYDAINTISDFMAKNGVTTYLPTLITQSKENMKAAAENIK